MESAEAIPMMVQEELDQLYLEWNGVPPQAVLEKACSRLENMVSSSFWIMANEKEAERRMLKDHARDEKDGVWIDDRDMLIESGVIDADLYDKRWLVGWSGSDDVVEMMDTFEDAQKFRWALIESGEINDEDLDAAAAFFDRNVKKGA